MNVKVTKKFVTNTKQFCDYLLTNKYLLLSQNNFVNIMFATVTKFILYNRRSFFILCIT